MKSRPTSDFRLMVNSQPEPAASEQPGATSQFLSSPSASAANPPALPQTPFGGLPFLCLRLLRKLDSPQFRASHPKDAASPDLLSNCLPRWLQTTSTSVRFPPVAAKPEWSSGWHALTTLPPSENRPESRDYLPHTTGFQVDPWFHLGLF